MLALTDDERARVQTALKEAEAIHCEAAFALTYGSAEIPTSFSQPGLRRLTDVSGPDGT